MMEDESNLTRRTQSTRRGDGSAPSAPSAREEKSHAEVAENAEEK